MAQKDLHSLIDPQLAMSIVNDVDFNGDEAGQPQDTFGFNSIELMMIGGDVSPNDPTSTYSLRLQESDNFAGPYTDVLDEFILGDLATAVIVFPGQQSFSLGYIGNKRWIRTMIKVENTTAGNGIEVLASISIRSNAPHIPFQTEPLP